MRGSSACRSPMRARGSRAWPSSRTLPPPTPRCSTGSPTTARSIRRRSRPITRRLLIDITGCGDGDPRTLPAAVLARLRRRGFAAAVAIAADARRRRGAGTVRRGNVEDLPLAALRVEPVILQRAAPRRPDDGRRARGAAARAARRALRPDRPDLAGAPARRRGCSPRAAATGAGDRRRARASPIRSPQPPPSAPPSTG